MPNNICECSRSDGLLVFHGILKCPECIQKDIIEAAHKLDGLEGDIIGGIIEQVDDSTLMHVLRSFLYTQEEFYGDKEAI